MPPLESSLLAPGGPATWIIFALGVILVVVFIERALYLHRGQIRSTAFLSGIKNILAKRRLVEALTVCEETPGPVAAVVKAALLHSPDDVETVRFHVQEAAIVEVPALERRLGSIAAIAQVAPLAGLLGTVLGRAATFIAFEKGGDYATPHALAGGLWQALLGTAGGLTLAIPAHIAHHFLASRGRAIVRDIEWSGNEIMKYLLVDYRAGPAESPAPAEERK